MAISPQRPTSPHLQVYRLPLTGIISISHRISGVLLTFGLGLVVYLLIAVASGGKAYAEMQAVMELWPLKLLYWGFLFAWFFHLCHGVRHLVWDAGLGFGRERLDRYARLELGCAFVLTLLAVVLL